LGFRTDGQVESVNHVDIATLSGKRGRVRAKYFVLACGGVENARLLLLSNDVKPNGLGNDRDQVGRFYMDHLFGRIGHAWTADPDIWERHGLTEHDHETTSEFARVSGDPLRVRPFAVLSEAWQRRHEVLNIGLLADKVEKDEETFPLSRKNGPLLDFRASLVGLSETAPNKDSRVMLSGEKDPLGLRRVLLDWRLSEIDLRTQAAMAQAFGTEMARLNIARMRIDDWIETQDWSAAIGRNDEPLTGSSHHMGTTRMSDTPVDGVVNRHCAVHDLHNMYIAGSSVFPTCGFVNPTLTIVALALRVADQLKQKLAYP
jgi:choline dehydrogenase-like flavoprotein